MFIEIISHCFCAKFKSYAHLLNYQLSSLVLHEPSHCELGACICTHCDDEYTIEFVYWFMKHTSIKIRLLLLTKQQMSCRAIGRNEAGLTTKADIVWFADCDYLFREHSMSQLASLNWGESEIVFPQWVKVNNWNTERNKWQGMKDLASAVKCPCIVDIDPNEFIPKKYFRAVGGAQIVKGDWIRHYGYLKDHSKIQKGKDDWFAYTRDDVVFRRGHKCNPVDIKGIYRIMHNERGCKVK